MRRRGFFRSVLAVAALTLVERVPGLALAVPKLPYRPELISAVVAYLSEPSLARQILTPTRVYKQSF